MRTPVLENDRSADVLAEEDARRHRERYGKAHKRVNAAVERRDVAVAEAHDRPGREAGAARQTAPAAPAHPSAAAPGGNGRDPLCLKPVLTTGEAAHLCGVSQQTIIRCFDRGLLRGYRVPGSVFRRIPRDAMVEFMRRNGMPTDHLATEHRKPRVLIVDHDAHWADSLLDALRSGEALEVEAATAAYDAGVLTQRFAPDMVVIDPAMPDSASATVLDRIRADARFAGVMVVLVCDPAHCPEDATHAERGAMAVFLKPASVLRVKAQVLHLLGVGAGQPATA